MRRIQSLEKWPYWDRSLLHPPNSCCLSYLHGIQLRGSPRTKHYRIPVFLVYQFPTAARGHWLLGPAINAAWSDTLQFPGSIYSHAIGDFGCFDASVAGPPLHPTYRLISEMQSLSVAPAPLSHHDPFTVAHTKVPCEDFFKEALSCLQAGGTSLMRNTGVSLPTSGFRRRSLGHLSVSKNGLGCRSK
jgi:hypothetical protein